MDGLRVYHTEQSSSEDKHHMISLICGPKLRHELIYDTETDSQTQITDLWFPGRGEGKLGSLGLVDAN